MLALAPMPVPPTPPSDVELFDRVAQSDSPARSRAAKQELYERHAAFLFAVLTRRAHRLLSLCSWTPEDLLQETFTRAFERAATFRGEAGLDEVSQRQRTRAWLGRIAERLLADSLRASKEVLGGPELETVADPGPPSSGSPTAHLVREALAQLTERERDVLRVSALYMRVGETHQRLPNEVAAELARRWGTDNDNVRAIRHRAMTKVKQYVQAAMVTPGEES